MLTRATGSKLITILEDTIASNYLLEHVSIPPILRERKENKYYSKSNVNLLRAITVYKDRLNRVQNGPARSARVATTQ